MGSPFSLAWDPPAPAEPGAAQSGRCPAAPAARAAPDAAPRSSAAAPGEAKVDVYPMYLYIYIYILYYIMYIYIYISIFII